MTAPSSRRKGPVRWQALTERLAGRPRARCLPPCVAEHHDTQPFEFPRGASPARRACLRGQGAGQSPTALTNHTRRRGRTTYRDVSDRASSRCVMKGLRPRPVVTWPLRRCRAPSAASWAREQMSWFGAAFFMVRVGTLVAVGALGDLTGRRAPPHGGSPADDTGAPDDA